MTDIAKRTHNTKWLLIQSDTFFGCKLAFTEDKMTHFLFHWTVVALHYCKSVNFIRCVLSSQKLIVLMCWSRKSQMEMQAWFHFIKSSSSEASLRFKFSSVFKYLTYMCDMSSISAMFLVTWIVCFLSNIRFG